MVCCGLLRAESVVIYLPLEQSNSPAKLRRSKSVTLLRYLRVNVHNSIHSHRSARQCTWLNEEEFLSGDGTEGAIGRYGDDENRVAIRIRVYNTFSQVCNALKTDNVGNQNSCNQLLN